jgi:flavin reductase (DIM6/NTAB) family NADH-FMN oxidoreductase RutF
VEKVKISGGPFTFPMPTVLVGATVTGKPNFETIAYCNGVSRFPPIIMVSSNRAHYTNAGIKENKTFSVNIPQADLVKATDYCGLVSGHKVDKSRVFEVFYGELKTAPLIKECALNIECKLYQIIELPRNDVFLGEIVAGYAEEKYLTEGIPDLKKFKPIIYTRGDHYWHLGDYLAKAFSIGKDFIPG